ncbi:MAG: glycoside hydrolase family 28 protein [Salinivirgaceae bacterium]|jgi:polygalacturonase|nr:glycoside hydrolase family 28 protein [Salinivirgaceae bacterium]
MKHFIYLFFLVFFACQNSNTKVNNLADDNGLLENPWEYMDSILNVIQPIIFPDTVFNISYFGAVGDGKTDCSEAIKNAIVACHDAGGGKVEIDSGSWLTGPIKLKSNVNLHINEGATVLFTTDKSKYLPNVHTRFEGMECMNYSPLIYAYKQSNIAITGKGKIDGQGEVWWHWKGQRFKSVDQESTTNLDESQNDDVALLTQMVEDNMPLEQRVFGEGHYLRSSFIQPYLCTNVLIEGITIVRAPMWIIHPVLSENVTVRKVKIESLGPNNDGCDPECCTNVLIDSCYFNTGDDCIAIKSGRNNDGRRVGVPSKNIIVQNCMMVEGHGGVVMGSEISGNVSHVFVKNCIMDSPNLERAIRIKSNTLRGGTVEHIYVRDIEVKQVKEAVLKINMHYGIYAQSTGNNIPIVRNVYMENVNSQKSKYGYWIKGIENHPVSGIYLKNCSFNNVDEKYFSENAGEVSMNRVKINEEYISN